MVTLDELGIDIYADVGSPEEITQQRANQWAKRYVQGFTTNPSLMRGARIADYEIACRQMVKAADHCPISFEVFGDSPAEMLRQARLISSWGGSVFVKIPIVDTRGESTYEVIYELAHEGIKLNVTAIMTCDQILEILDCFEGTPGFGGTPTILSVFAGRIMDTGEDPEGWLWSLHCRLRLTSIKLLWASCREVYNIFQAAKAGCKIITVPPAILAKLPLLGKDLNDYSTETATQFYNDAQRSGFRL